MSYRGLQYCECEIRAEDTPPGRFFVAEVVEPKKSDNLSHFTKNLAMMLGRQGIVRTHNALHVTVGNRLTRHELCKMGYTTKEVKDYAIRLGSMLTHTFGEKSEDIAVDRERPLIWVGQALALKVSNPELIERRQAVDDFFKQETGTKLDDSFEPHVSVARVNGNIMDKFHYNPEWLASRAVIPNKIGVGAVRVCIGRIHQRELVWKRLDGWSPSGR